MENITTKLKTRFLSSSASSDAEALADKQAREDKQSENYKDTETFSYQGVARLQETYCV
ncbi:MAG: hypothetical protein HYV52_00565 [Parcubacteria group bacterium]|nr:hypothetical protein [Parcubacteria group bacterium]